MTVTSIVPLVTTVKPFLYGMPSRYVPSGASVAMMPIFVPEAEVLS